MADILAVCFDFYNTLVSHREGSGRGSRLMQYLEEQGVQSDPWEHQVLYDVFEPHAREYSPTQPQEARQEYYCRLTERVFERLKVRPRLSAAEHAPAIWSILGPASLALFPEVPAVLRSLKLAGYRTAVISNWQCGLANFCVELGIGGDLDYVISSAEVGAAKPDPAIFHEASCRLGIGPERILHVGDTIVDDVEGAERAGFHAVLVRRQADGQGAPGACISTLDDVLSLLGVAKSP